MTGAGPGRTRARRRALLIVLAVALALAGVAAGVTLAQPGRGAHWALVWSDSFTGRAGAGASPQSWAYQTGSGVFGNGEIERATSSRANVHLDGRGALDITAVRQGTAWTSGRIRTRRTFGAPAGGAPASPAGGCPGAPGS